MLVNLNVKKAIKSLGKVMTDNLKEIHVKKSLLKLNALAELPSVVLSASMV